MSELYKCTHSNVCRDHKCTHVNWHKRNKNCDRPCGRWTNSTCASRLKYELLKVNKKEYLGWRKL